MTRVGLFGGTFDPIHRGHIEPVKEARQRLGLERVIYLPTAVPPHKPTREMAPPLARYAMVELALLHEPGLDVSAWELTLGRPAYTVETVEHWRRELPSAELYLLIGSDCFLELPRWLRWHDIAAAARLVVLSRPGWEASAAGWQAAATAAAPARPATSAAERQEPAAPATSAAERQELAALVAGGRVQFLGQRPCEVSSTRVRALLARGERPPAGWMPALVVDFVQKYNLYR